MKRVHYNGHTETEVSCQPATDLAGENARWGVGYEVEKEIDLGVQKNYVLKGMPRKDVSANPGYNSNWFRVVPVYLATIMNTPKVGERLEYFWRLDENGEWEEIHHTSKIVEVHPLASNMFEVYTQNSTYIVQLVK